MLSLELIIAGTIVLSLNFYMVLGGADYGGGVWDLLASGPRASSQRKLVAHAIGPVWEANHVWLILALTVLFTAFPAAFAAMAIDLHIPLLLVVLGIVFRGSAFAFRSYDLPGGRGQDLWERIFSISSLLTPVLLGVTLGAIASGGLAHSSRPGPFRALYVDSWLSPFPVAVGIFALTLFAFIAAVFLTLETGERELQDDFRRRALWTGVATGAMALAVFHLGETGAPELRRQLSQSFWTWPLQIATAVSALLTFGALCLRRFVLARAGVIVQSSLILWGWALAQFPYVIMPDLSLYESAAPRQTLVLLTVALSLGALVLIPSFLYLLWIFKGYSEASDFSVSSSSSSRSNHSGRG